MFKKLFKQAFIYGIATVLPRMLNFLLVPLYTDTRFISNAQYSEVSVIYAYFVLFNVILSYGMETAFFRFFHKNEDKEEVISTSTWSLIGSSLLFLGIGFLFQTGISRITGISKPVLHIVLWILALDALAVIPFAWLRAKGRPLRYAVIKILDVLLTIGLNIFFLVYLEDWSASSPILQKIYVSGNEVNYVFLASMIASGFVLVLLLPFYLKIRLNFNRNLLREMLKYAFPVLIAGLAYAVNEAFDRIMLDYLLPEEEADIQVGAYAACYKLALFITLFSTAFRLGIEPFFFSQAKKMNARKTYAEITKYFTILGTLILVGVIVFADLLKRIIITSDSYWFAMDIVPLILFANLCMGIYYNLSVWYKVTDRTKFGGYISLIAAVITIGVNLALIPTLGYIGAAIGTLAAYGSMMILSFWWGQKYYPIPYDLKKIGGYLALSVLFSCVYFYGFRGNYVVGIGFLMIFVGIIYFAEKEDLIQIIKEK